MSKIISALAFATLLSLSVTWRSVVKVLITALALITPIASQTFAQRQYPGESGQKDFNQGYPVWHCWDDVRCSAK